MRTACAIALVAALGGTIAADDKAALKELEGTYLLVGIETKGLKLGADMLKKEDPAERKMVIKGDQIVVAVTKGKDDVGTIKLDTSKTPPHIDITSTANGKTEVNYGIYKLEKGVLTVCTLNSGNAKDRPAKFEVGEKYQMLVFEKQPAKK